MTVEGAIAGRLLADGTVTAHVGTRVRQFILRQGETLPAIRVQKISDVEEKHLRGPQGSKRARVQVDVYTSADRSAVPYASAAEIADLVNTSLVYEPFDGDSSPVTMRIENVERVTMQPMYESEELRQVRMLLDYMVSYRTYV